MRFLFQKKCHSRECWSRNIYYLNGRPPRNLWELSFWSRSNTACIVNFVAYQSAQASWAKMSPYVFGVYTVLILWGFRNQFNCSVLCDSPLGFNVKIKWESKKLKIRCFLCIWRLATYVIILYKPYSLSGYCDNWISQSKNISENILRDYSDFDLFVIHNHFYGIMWTILSKLFSCITRRTKLWCGLDTLQTPFSTWTRLEVTEIIVSFPISPTYRVDAESLFFRGSSCNKDAMRSRMLYVPPEGGQRFNHDRWSSFQAARVFWLPGGSFIIANLKPQRAKEDRNLMGAEAEQSWCRILMGANAAEFQWEPSFVEQKQQACLFSFSVGDIAKEAHVFVQASPRACLLCKAYRSSYIELFCVSVHWDQSKLKWEC
mgnify:CR=1 FL=1